MIREDFIVYTKNGLYCKAGDFFIDPIKPVHKAIISHAHADHAVRGHDEIFCTQPTADVMKERYVEQAGKKFNLLNSKSCFSINDVKINFIPAGHMLGSVQVLLEYDNTKYLYTGDFKLQFDSTCESYEYAEADVLITESTFAEPNKSHPETNSEIEKLNAISDKGIVIGSYSLGKAQRLTQLISAICPQKEIFIHSKIYPFHKIYESHKISLGHWKPYSRQLFKRLKQCVYIVPPSVLTSYQGRKDYHTAFASGWDHLQNGYNLKLNISDHADWKDILTVIERTKPKKILTLHGDGEPLKKHFLNSEVEVHILN
jgi:putative mRNA 3-end processing factor